MQKEKKTKNWRENLFDMIEPSQYSGHISFYNILLLTVIVASTLVLMTKQDTRAIHWVEYIATFVFIIDYILRWITADFKLKEHKKHKKTKSQKPACSYFLKYPVTHMAIIDLIAILPGILDLNPSLRLFKLIRMFRTFRFFKTLRYSRSTAIIMKVFHRQKTSLIAVCLFAMEYILVCALIIFNVEPETFRTFFDAIYWATVSLTTVGYGDIYPVSTIGRVITMVSSVFGIAVIAMPAGIITAGFMQELEEQAEASERQ